MARRKKKGDRGYEKQQVYEAFMEYWRYKPCIVCGTTYKTCGHHLIGKGSCPRHIVTPRNIEPACQKHHTFSNDIAPHSSNPFAVEAFNNLIRDKMPEKWEWMKEHQHDTSLTNGKIPWSDLYEKYVDDSDPKKPMWSGEMEEWE